MCLSRGAAGDDEFAPRPAQGLNAECRLNALDWSSLGSQIWQALLQELDESQSKARVEAPPSEPQSYLTSRYRLLERSMDRRASALVRQGVRGRQEMTYET